MQYLRLTKISIINNQSYPEKKKRISKKKEKVYLIDKFPLIMKFQFQIE